MTIALMSRMGRLNIYQSSVLLVFLLPQIEF
nr:MAG TPA: hypothetical protein [Caudoviricetes sp.]